MPTTFASYPVVDAQPVSVEVLSGDGQPATITVVLGGQIIAHATNHVGPMTIGLGKALRTNKLVVSATVSVLNPDTTKTSVALELTGGPESKEVKTEQSGPAGGKVYYVDVVSFT